MNIIVVNYMDLHVCIQAVKGSVFQGKALIMKWYHPPKTTNTLPTSTHSVPTMTKVSSNSPATSSSNPAVIYTSQKVRYYCTVQHC